MLCRWYAALSVISAWCLSDISAWMKGRHLYLNLCKDGASCNFYKPVSWPQHHCATGVYNTNTNQNSKESWVCLWQPTEHFHPYFNNGPVMQVRTSQHQKNQTIPVSERGTTSSPSSCHTAMLFWQAFESAQLSLWSKGFDADFQDCQWNSTHLPQFTIQVYASSFKVTELFLYNEAKSHSPKLFTFISVPL